MVKIRGRILTPEAGCKSKKGDLLRNPARVLCLIVVMLLAAGAARAENETSEPAPATEPLGIALEGFPYPYPVNLFPLSQEGERLRVAYMDVAPNGDANGRIVLLLHGTESAAGRHAIRPP
jgi:hypothetical protein